MKSKFYQKNGLTVYALACGYIQRVTNSTSLNCDSTEVDLYLDSCFHVRTFGNWQCLDTIIEARKAWQEEVKRVFNKELKAYKAQKRASVSLQCIGKETPKHVLLWCGEFVQGYDTKQAAEVLAGALVLLDPEARQAAIEYLRNKRNN